MNEIETGYTPADSEFRSFNKLARLNREIVITEKLDGTNAQVLIIPTRDMGVDHANRVTAWNGEFALLVGSRNRWITPSNDNYGFARWCMDNFGELVKLGLGRHFGEWWGSGIQRGYGLKEKRFSLFNVSRWLPCCSGPGILSQNERGECNPGPACCHVVPTLWRGPFGSGTLGVMEGLRLAGSAAAPGFMDPEGIVIYHTAAKTLFKVTLKNDDKPKSLV